MGHYELLGLMWTGCKELGEDIAGAFFLKKPHADAKLKTEGLLVLGRVSACSRRVLGRIPLLCEGMWIHLSCLQLFTGVVYGH